MPASAVETPPPFSAAPAVVDTPPPVATAAVEASGSVRTRWRLPVEAVVALIAVAVYIAGLLAGLPVNLPDMANIRFIQAHYFSPLFAACALQLVAVIASGRKDRSRPLLTLKLFPFLGLTLFIHFTFKAWMPLVNPVSYDPVYHAADVALAPVLNAFLWVRTAIADASPVSMDAAYHTLFITMFFVSVSVHALVDTSVRQRQLVLGLCLILMIGGAMYCVMPAVGPFLYRDGLSPDGTVAQWHVFEKFQVVASTGQIPPGYFTCPLAAMPSLHNAHALFLTLFALRSVRWLGIAYLPILFWIVIESVASAWHYLADLPVGMVLAVAVLVLVRRLIPDAPTEHPAESVAAA